jgi:hypothetical protein
VSQPIIFVGGIHALGKTTLGFGWAGGESNPRPSAQKRSREESNARSFNEMRRRPSGRANSSFSYVLLTYPDFERTSERAFSKEHGCVWCESQFSSRPEVVENIYIFC